MIASSASAAIATKANSQIRIAVIGLNGRGKIHINGLAPHVVALCDCDQAVLSKATKQFAEKHGRKVDAVADFRRILDRKDIDAVAIATPNHTHSMIGVLAAQAGKHVYCEKPVSQNVWEGRQLVNAAKRYDRIIQTGTQSRSNTQIAEAVDWVKAGSLGKIRHVTGLCYKPRPSIGLLEKPLVIPASVDYDLWCGPVTKEKLYRPQFHYDWHWDFHTGSGDMGNQGIHQMDVARWFLGYDTLSPRVLSIGGRLGYEDAGNTPNTIVTLHDYPEAPILFETRGLPRSKSDQSDWSHSMDRYRGVQIGIIVQCEKGYVRVDGLDADNTAAYDNAGNLVKQFEGMEESDSTRHFNNFIAAIRAEDSSLLNAPIVEGHLSSALCHTGNISYQLGEAHTAGEVQQHVHANELLANSVDRMLSHLRLNGVDVNSPVLTIGKTLTMDPAAEQFTNSNTANEMLRRKDRRSFAVPLV